MPVGVTVPRASSVSPKLLQQACFHDITHEQYLRKQVWLTHRFMTEQLVPASLEVEHTTHDGSRFLCVGLDASSTADELVEGVVSDLQQVIVKMKQATNTQYTPSVKIGGRQVAVLHTLIQVSSIIDSMPRCGGLRFPEGVPCCVPVAWHTCLSVLTVLLM